MKRFSIIILLVSASLSSLAQDQSAREKIEAARIALITERLELTPEQAEKFWPVYREYSMKQRQIRQEFKELKRNFDPNKATEDESKKILDRGHSIKQRQLELEQVYSQRMQQVVTSRQLMNLRKAEQDFREMLMNRIREENAQRRRLEGDRQRNEQQIRKRKNN
ncbi:MAG: hypothetical protein JXR03_05060 [Cyclobacteriaceae bacterium]